MDKDIEAIAGLTLLCSHRYAGCGWATEARFKVGSARVGTPGAVPTHDEVLLANTKGKVAFSMPRAGLLEVLRTGHTEWTGPADTRFRVEVVGGKEARR